MYCRKDSFCLVILFLVPLNTSMVINLESSEPQNSSQIHQDEFLKASSNSLSEKNSNSDDAHESSNIFTSDDFDTSSDYTGDLFDNFPGLPYFPDFGEIFRITQTTTPRPPFSFPDYVRDVFPERPSENLGDTASTYFSDSLGESGSRRPTRRPQQPASSGTRTKVSKQNEPRENPNKIIKNKILNKSRDYPKIFRFTSDRVSLAEFDMKKKMNENYLTLTKGDELDSDKVKRNKFLILHGGVFEIERSGRLNLFPASSEVHEVITQI